MDRTSSSATLNGRPETTGDQLPVAGPRNPRSEADRGWLQRLVSLIEWPEDPFPQRALLNNHFTEKHCHFPLALDVADLLAVHDSRITSLNCIRLLSCCA